jgi:hypothetical protein
MTYYKVPTYIMYVYVYLWGGGCSTSAWDLDLTAARRQEVYQFLSILGLTGSFLWSPNDFYHFVGTILS